jgi:hypothetical protein
MILVDGSFGHVNVGFMLGLASMFVTSRLDSFSCCCEFSGFLARICCSILSGPFGIWNIWLVAYLAGWAAFLFFLIVWC